MNQTYGYIFYYISGTLHDLIETTPNMFANLYLLHMNNTYINCRTNYC